MPVALTVLCITVGTLALVAYVIALVRESAWTFAFCPILIAAFVAPLVVHTYAFVNQVGPDSDNFLIVTEGDTSRIITEGHTNRDGEWARIWYTVKYDMDIPATTANGERVTVKVTGTWSPRTDNLIDWMKTEDLTATYAQTAIVDGHLRNLLTDAVTQVTRDPAARDAKTYAVDILSATKESTDAENDPAVINSVWSASIS